MSEEDIEKLPGVGPAILEKLREAGYCLLYTSDAADE